MPVRSIVTSPANGTKLRRRHQRGPPARRGWAGDHTVRAVDVSIDYGGSWQRPTSVTPGTRYDWQRWTATRRLPSDGYYEIWARATDARGVMQPHVAGNWNPQGYGGQPDAPRRDPGRMTVPVSRSGLQRLAAGALTAVWALAAAGLLLVLPAADSAGQSTPGKPVEEQPEHYPNGPNREDTFYFCIACHGFKIVAAQGMSRARWNETLDIMVTRHGMPDMQGADREKMLDYLAGAFPERTERRGWKSPFAQ